MIHNWRTIVKKECQVMIFENQQLELWQIGEINSIKKNKTETDFEITLCVNEFIILKIIIPTFVLENCKKKKKTTCHVSVSSPPLYLKGGMFVGNSVFVIFISIYNFIPFYTLNI